jgi:hypothetical protein
MPEFFASIEVRQVHFDKGDFGGQHGVSQSNARVGEASEVNQHIVDLRGSCGMDAVDKLPFAVALKAVERMTRFDAGGTKAQINVVKGISAVYFGLSAAEKIEIGSIQYEYRCHSFATLFAICAKLPIDCQFSVHFRRI